MKYLVEFNDKEAKIQRRLARISRPTWREMVDDVLADREDDDEFVPPREWGKAWDATRKYRTVSPVLAKSQAIIAQVAQYFGITVSRLTVAAGRDRIARDMAMVMITEELGRSVIVKIKKVLKVGSNYKIDNAISWLRANWSKKMSADYVALYHQFGFTNRRPQVPLMPDFRWLRLRDEMRKRLGDDFESRLKLWELVNNSGWSSIEVANVTGRTISWSQATLSGKNRPKETPKAKPGRKYRTYDREKRKNRVAAETAARAESIRKIGPKVKRGVYLEIQKRPLNALFNSKLPLRYFQAYIMHDMGWKNKEVQQFIPDYDASRGSTWWFRHVDDLVKELDLMDEFRRVVLAFRKAGEVVPLIDKTVQSDYE